MPFQYPTADDLRKALGIKPISWDTLSRMSRPDTDPWVKVGTTTIDGTLEQVGGLMLNNGKPSTLRPDTIEEFIDGRVRSQEPLQVGGRWLRLVGSHINSHTGTAIIRCDIVRRQSEIDAEMIAEIAPACNELAAILRPVCPECGPHGNAGRVLLLESWADCTTCRPASKVLAIDDLVFDEHVEVERVLTGFSDGNYVTFNGYPFLTSPPEGVSWEQYRRLMFGEV